MMANMAWEPRCLPAALRPGVQSPPAGASARRGLEEQTDKPQRGNPGMGNSTTDYYQALYQVVKTVNSSLDPQTVLQSIAESVSWAMNVKACSIRLLSEDGRYLLASATHGLSKGYMRKGKVEVEKSGIDQEVLQGGNVQLCNVCEDSRFQYPEAARKEGIESVLAVPLSLERERTIGVLRVYSAERREFGQDETDFLNAVADVCALAIQNARIHKRLETVLQLQNEYEFRLFED
jgi:signal transduction protein with GAF and PtsI domain